MRHSVRAPGWAAWLISDLTDMDRDPRHVSPGEVVEHELPDDVYFEYAFETADRVVLPDPSNPNRVRNLWYGEVSYVTGPDYRPSELADPPRDIATGTADRLRLESSLLGQTRRVTVYTPATVAPDEATPLAVVQDGVAFQRVGNLHLVHEALLGRGRVEPLRLAFVEPSDRAVEYAFHEPYLRFVEEELEPELVARYPLTRRRVWVGASLGALASATLALRRAERDPQAARDDGVLSLSGAFLGTPEDFDPYLSRESWLLARLRDPDVPLPGAWHLHVGTLEWLHDVNRAAGEALAARGDVRSAYTERSAGHNWRNWRDALADAMSSVSAAMKDVVARAPGGD